MGIASNIFKSYKIVWRVWIAIIFVYNAFMLWVIEDEYHIGRDIFSGKGLSGGDWWLLILMVPVMLLGTLLMVMFMYIILVIYEFIISYRK